jgi:nitrite reductase/ring-hydroxylating ferredoxin subunit
MRNCEPIVEMDTPGEVSQGYAQVGPGRRALLRLSFWLAGAALLRGLYEFLTYREPMPSGGRYILGPLAAFPPGSRTFVAAARAWVVRDGGGLYALSAVCTHLGCTVQNDGSILACPCHGSKYDGEGKVLAGPASRPLEYYAIDRASNGDLLLDAKEAVPATQRLSDSEAGSG